MTATSGIVIYGKVTHIIHDGIHVDARAGCFRREVLCNFTGRRGSAPKSSSASTATSTDHPGRSASRIGTA